MKHEQLMSAPAVRYWDGSRDLVGHIRRHDPDMDMYDVDMEDGRELRISSDVLHPMSPKELRQHREQEEQRRKAEAYGSNNTEA
ncbi:hypothetical protein ACWFMI_23575 [Nocardiopsis terrae]|uniref:hypothetical protein n=1 Tax=Streptomyces sp. NPDC057554 TaxID=3350538 RepID=UPI0036BC3A29